MLIDYYDSVLMGISFIATFSECLVIALFHTILLQSGALRDVWVFINSEMFPLCFSPLHYTTLHYTELHYTTQRYMVLHYITLYLTLKSTVAMHHNAVRFVRHHCAAPRNATINFVLQCTTLHCFCIILCDIVIYCIISHCVTKITRRFLLS